MAGGIGFSDWLDVAVESSRRGSRSTEKTEKHEPYKESKITISEDSHEPAKSKSLRIVNLLKVSDKQKALKSPTISNGVVQKERWPPNRVVNVRLARA